MNLDLHYDFWVFADHGETPIHHQPPVIISFQLDNLTKKH